MTLWMNEGRRNGVDHWSDMLRYVRLEQAYLASLAAQRLTREELAA